jgi:hypothetical protein
VLADKKLGWFKWSSMENTKFCIIFYLGTSSGFVTVGCFVSQPLTTNSSSDPRGLR